MFSKNVELIGRVRFWTGVIGRQRWTSPKKLVRPRKYEALQKKDTATIFSFELCHGISMEPTILGPRWFCIGAQISILWPCLFLQCLLAKYFFEFDPTLTANNFGLNLQILKSTTFSESSARQLSHGTLDRAYPFKILSYLRFSFSSFCVFLAFSAQSHCKNTQSECLDSSIDFFAWFHIVCHRYASK